MLGIVLRVCFQYVTISLVVGCSPPLLILSENYRYVLLKHERYCEHFLEIMLHVFIDILCIYVNMYSLVCCVYTLIILALNN